MSVSNLLTADFIVVVTLTDAKINECNQCVLGTTNKAEDFGKNCKGGCAENRFKVFTELGGACMPIDTDPVAIISKLYCDGNWRSGARIDS